MKTEPVAAGGAHTSDNTSPTVPPLVVAGGKTLPDQIFGPAPSFTPMTSLQIVPTSASFGLTKAGADEGRQR